MPEYHMEIECTLCKNRARVVVIPPLPDIGTTISGTCYSKKCEDINEDIKHTVISHLSE